MRSRHIIRYGCDFCKKIGYRKSSMAAHESRCVGNPARVCNLHKYGIEDQQRPIEELKACVTYEKTDYGLADLRKLAGSCPCCILAGIVQAKIQSKDDWAEYGPIDYKFDFKAEMAAYWVAENDRNSDIL